MPPREQRAESTGQQASFDTSVFGDRCCLCDVISDRRKALPQRTLLGCSVFSSVALAMHHMLCMYKHHVPYVHMHIYIYDYLKKHAWLRAG